MIKAAVLDTNTVLGAINSKAFFRLLDALFPKDIRFVSVITQIELLGYPDITKEEEAEIRDFLRITPIIPMDNSIAELSIQLLRVKPSIKLPDAVIAATAIDFNAMLVTNDAGLLKLEFPGFHVMGIESNA